MNQEHYPAYRGLVGTSLGLLHKGYAAEYVPAANLREAVRGTLQRAPYSFKDFEAFVDSTKRGENEHFAVLAHEGEGYKYLGHTGIHRVTWPDGVGTTGSILCEEASQGKGHGTEAKLLLLYHCFYLLGLRNVRSMVKAWNARSLGHLIKCGYRVVGRFDRIVFHEGEMIDELILQVRREDFVPIWERYQETKELPKLTDKERDLVKNQSTIK